MKLGLRKKLRLLYLGFRSVKFRIVKFLFGFEFANQMIQTLDKQSLLHILRCNGATIGKNCDIETGLTFHNCVDYSNLKIGNNCHIGKNCFFDLKEKIIIKNNVTISMNCTLLTHQDLGKSVLELKYPKEKATISIGNHAYIGACSTILKGCSIGEKSIVAAGSIVNNNVEKSVIVGGLPAKKIKNIKL